MGLWTDCGDFNVKFKRFREKIAAFMQHLWAALTSLMEDFFILCGLGIVVFATFRVCEIAGWYTLGACLFGLGAWMATHPKRK